MMIGLIWIGLKFDAIHLGSGGVKVGVERGRLHLVIRRGRFWVGVKFQESSGNRWLVDSEAKVVSSVYGLN
jgi:hypothetical protein